MLLFFCPPDDPLQKKRVSSINDLAWPYILTRIPCVISVRPRLSILIPDPSRHLPNEVISTWSPHWLCSHCFGAAQSRVFYTMSLFLLRAHPVGVYLLLKCEYLHFKIEQAVKTIVHYMWFLGHGPQGGGRNLTSTYFFIVTMGLGLFKVRLLMV